MQKAPFNVKILDPEEYIPRKNCLPVSSFSMYEPSSTRFHPDGLFSEVIFGQIGSSSRLIKRGYLDLHTKIITPHLFKQIVSMKKTLYTGIMNGTTYAYFDKQLKDFVKVEQDDPRADTGYSFFVNHIAKVKFQSTDSVTRENKIQLIDKYNDKLLIDKYLVLPAGLRDVKIKAGRPSSEAINKLYYGVLSLTNAIPDGYGEDPMYDPIRYQLQMKVVEVYDYILNIVNGKHGFGQGKYGARDVVYSNRNVITAAVMNTADNPDSGRVFSIEDLELPLFQAMKGATPLVIHWLGVLFFNQRFSTGTNQIYLINPETLSAEFCTVTDADMKKFSTAEGLEKIINDFRNQENQFKPVTMNVINEKGKEVPYYFGLIYDTGDTINVVSNVEDFKIAHSQQHRYKDEHPYLQYFEQHTNIPTSEYITLGSVACYSYGMKIVPEDLDIVVSPEHLPKLEQLGDVKRDTDGDLIIQLDTLELHVKNASHGIANKQKFDKLKESCTKINTHTFFTAERLLKRYAEINRTKDKYKIKFLSSIVVDMTKLRPMTYVEMCYMATYRALYGRHVTATRYPVLEIHSLMVYKIHLMSTSVSREVTQSVNGRSIVYPEYPKLDSPVRASMSVHPSTLELYGGDHDGRHLHI